MLLSRARTVARLVDGIAARLPEVQSRIRAKLSERLAALGAEGNPERFEQEIAILVQKMDVAEELDRLKSHVAELTNTLASGDAVGRKLDFLMQEFNREANMLSSKSQDVETTRSAVELKVLIEQLREQVQNVEQDPSALDELRLRGCTPGARVNGSQTHVGLVSLPPVGTMLKVWRVRDLPDVATVYIRCK